VLVFEVLLIVIGVLVLLGLLVMGRSRRGGSDPSTSVDAFNRALSAMEPGAGGATREAAASDATPDSEGTPDGSAEEQPDGSAR
jgi:hypothetical protein